MAKPEHLARIEESVEVWNTWRGDNPEITPALWGADLEGADLQGANLNCADLEEAELSESYLNYADLRGAKLRSADLRGANLGGADLDRADLKSADLEGADLRGVRYLLAEQLCKTKTLYKAKLDPELEREIMQECPRLFD